LDTLEDPDDDGWTGNGLDKTTLLMTCVEVCCAEAVVLKVVGEVIAPVGEITSVFGFAGDVAGSSVRPGGGVMFNVLDNGL